MTLKTPLMMMLCMASATAPAWAANPFTEPYGTPYDIPPFERITSADYLPAVRQGIAQKKAQIEAITSNSATPTFENTILAMEESGDLLTRTAMVFGALDESNSSPEMVAVAAELYPLVQQADDDVSMNPELFSRIKYLYDHLEALNLAPNEDRAVREAYRKMVRNGALLDDAGKARLRELNGQLTDLYLKFNKNLLDATNAFEIVVDDASRLSGLPASSVAQAADEARARGYGDGKWVFTLHAPSRLPLLQNADDRDLRRQMYEGYTSLASSGQYDNGPVINKILRARSAKAKLLGYDDFAAYQTANVMAKTPAAAEDLLMKIWAPAVEKVKEEVAEMQALADKRGDNITIAPWDYYYYSDKVRADKFNLDENQVRAYFAVDSVRRGIFDMAGRLYGLKFTEMPDAPKYHPEVKVYDVTDAKDGSHVAVFMTDYFPRASKRQGAWMSEFVGSYTDRQGVSHRPIVYNVGNFSRPTADAPALLTLDEVETMFHEFGHGLHGMLSRAALRSQAGTNTDRDFVELPSQIHEHWALEPELLKTYARHWQTGEVIPDSLVQKLQDAATQGQGFATTELAGAALLDLNWGHVNLSDQDPDMDVVAFENQVAQKLGMPKELTYRYRSPYFKHIFGSNEYASGYYTYLWAEVLDTDGFELFKEKGVFDPATAQSFRHNVLEQGGSQDPMTLYVNFRGAEPTVDALLRNRGLTPAKADHALPDAPSGK